MDLKTLIYVKAHWTRMAEDGVNFVARVGTENKYLV
jgi:hypothetical protein